MKRAKGTKGKLDVIHSKLTRERSNWTCDRCGKFFPEGRRQGIHWSHWIGRARMATRYHPSNVWAHCYGCHRYLEGHRFEFDAFVEERIGRGMMEMLLERSKTIPRYRKRDYEEMLEHYRNELAKMQAKRADGVTSRIEFLAWD